MTSSCVLRCGSGGTPSGLAGWSGVRTFATSCLSRAVHVQRREDFRLRRADQGGRTLCRGPYPGLQDLKECLGLSVAVEVEIDDDVAGVVDRTLDAVVQYAGRFAGRGEAVERRLPGREVGDGVLDVQCGHGAPPGGAGCLMVDGSLGADRAPGAALEDERAVQMAEELLAGASNGAAPLVVE